MFLQTHAITNTDLLKNNSLIYSTFVTWLFWVFGGIVYLVVILLFIIDYNC